MPWSTSLGGSWGSGGKEDPESRSMINRQIVGFAVDDGRDCEGLRNSLYNARIHRDINWVGGGPLGFVPTYWLS